MGKRDKRKGPPMMDVSPYKYLNMAAISADQLTIILCVHVYRYFVK